jgi:hypothetical protein
MAWYRVVLECSGVPPDAGLAGATHITEAFVHRPWHQNVRCSWDGTHLILTAENDFDADGLALTDEFSDEISACISGGFDGNLRVVSIMEVPRGA